MHRRIEISVDTINRILYISQTRLDKSFKALQHSHPNLEILYITNGIGKIKTIEQVIHFKKDDIILINANTIHFEISTTNCEFYAIGVKNLDFMDKNNNHRMLCLHLKAKEAYAMSCIYELIYHEAIQKRKDYLEMIDHCFNIVKTILLREDNLSLEEVNNSKVSNLVANIENIIHFNFSNNIKLSDLANQLNISVSKLCHTFKKEKGCSIIDYKLMCQIEEAKNLLNITDMTMIEICSIVGFNNSSYFSKVFKEKVGCTPKEYKRHFN